MAVSCSFINGEVINRYNKFKESHNGINYDYFTVEVFNSVLTSLYSANKNLSIENIDDETIYNAFKRAKVAYRKVSTFSYDNENDFANEKNISVVSFGAKNGAIFLNKENNATKVSLGITNLVAKRIVGRSNYSVETTTNDKDRNYVFSSLMDELYNKYGAIDFNLASAESIYQIATAMYFNDKIKEVKELDSKKKTSEVDALVDEFIKIRKNENSSGVKNKKTLANVIKKNGEITDNNVDSYINKALNFILEIKDKKTGTPLVSHYKSLAEDESVRIDAETRELIKKNVDEAQQKSGKFLKSKEDIISTMKYLINVALKNPKTRFIINQGNDFEEKDGLGITGKTYVKYFISAINEMNIPIPTNIHFSETWVVDSGNPETSLVTSTLTEDQYNDLNNTDIDGLTEYANTIVNSDIRMTLQERQEIVDFLKMAIKHHIKYLANRDNIPTSKVPTQMKKELHDLIKNSINRKDNIDAIFAYCANSFVDYQSKSGDSLDDDFIENAKAIEHIFTDDGSLIKPKGKNIIAAKMLDSLHYFTNEEDGLQAYNDKAMFNRIVNNLKDNSIFDSMFTIAMREISGDLGVKMGFEDVDEEYNDVEKTAKESIDGFSENFNNNPRLSMSKNIRYILSTLYDISIDEDGETIPSTSDAFKYVKTIDSEFAYNALMDMLVPMHNIDDMMTILKYNAAVHPWINQLLDILEKNPSTKTAFYCSFAKSFNQFTTFLSSETNGAGKFHGQERFIFHNNPEGIYYLLDQWRHNIEAKNPPKMSIFKVKDGEIINDKEGSKSIYTIAHNLIDLKTYLTDSSIVKQRLSNDRIVADVYTSILDGDAAMLLQTEKDNNELDPKDEDYDDNFVTFTQREKQILSVCHDLMDNKNIDISKITKQEVDLMKGIGININEQILKRVAKYYSREYQWKNGSKVNLGYVCQMEEIFNNIEEIAQRSGVTDGSLKMNSFDDYDSGETFSKDLISTFRTFYTNIASSIAKINNNTALLSSVYINGKAYYAHNTETNLDEVVKILTNSMSKYNISSDEREDAIRKYNEEINNLYRQYDWYYTAEKDANGNFVKDETTGAIKGVWKVDWLSALDINDVKDKDGTTIGDKVKQVLDFQKHFKARPMLSSDKKPYERYSKAEHMRVMRAAFERFGNESRYATYPFFTLSDLGTEMYVDGLKFSGFRAGDVTQEAIEKYANVAIQELDRIIKIKNQHPEGKSLVTDIDLYDKYGLKFNLLDSPILNNRIDELVDGYTKAKENPANAFSFNNKLNGLVKQYLQEKVSNSFDGLVDAGYFDTNQNGVGVFAKADEMTFALKDGTCNDALSKLDAILKTNGLSEETRNDISRLHKTIELAKNKSYEKHERPIIKHSTIQNMVSDINKDLDNDNLLNKVGSLDVMDYSVDEISCIGIGNFVINSDYARIQMANIFCTDLAFYGSGLNFAKRVKGYQSPYSKMDIHAKYVNGKGEIENIGKQFEKVMVLKDSKITSKLMTDGTNGGYAGSSIERVFSTALKNRQSIIDNDQSLNLSQREDAIRAAKEMVDDIQYAFTHMKSTDAAAFRTLSSYRSIMIMMDNENWTKEAENAYQNIISGKYTMDDFLVLQRQFKPFFNAPITITRNGEKIRVPFQIKNSEQLMVAAFAEVGMKYSKKYQNLQKYMESRGIDSVVYESCVKVGLAGTVNLDDFVDKNGNELSSEAFDKKMDEIVGAKQKDGEYSFNDSYIYNVDLERFGDQTATSDHLTDRKQAQGTQQKKLVFMDIPSTAKFNLQNPDGSNKEMSRDELLGLYNKLLSTKLLMNYERIKKEIGTKKRLSQALKRQILTDPSYDIADLNCISTYKDENGEDQFKLDVTDPIQAKRIYALISSRVRDCVTTYTKGGAVLNECCMGYSEADKPRLVMSDDKKSIKYIECYLPAYMESMYADFIKDDGHGNKTINFDAKNFPDELRDIIGYRIPTEDKYSVLPLKIKGFLTKAEGNSIILPEEITTLAGLDFDGDKFFLMIYDSERTQNEDGSWSYHKVKYDYNKEPWEQGDSNGKDKEMKINNALIDLTRAVLTHESSAEKILNPGNFNEQKKSARIGTLLTNYNDLKKKIDLGSFDNILKKHFKTEEAVTTFKSAITSTDAKGNPDSKAVLNALKSLDQDTLDSLSEEYRSRYETTSFLSQLDYSYQNTTGKALISIFALSNSLHAELVHSNFGLAPKQRFDLCGHNCWNLHEDRGFDGSFISKILASLLAASADTAKDPCLAELNANMYSAGAIAMLAEFGLSMNEITLFMRQPIINEIIKVRDKSARYMSTDAAISVALQNLSINNGLEVTDEDIRSVFSYGSTDKIGKVNPMAAKDDKFLSDSLAANIMNGSDHMTQAQLDEQMRVASLFSHIMEIADGFNQFTQLMRVDTTKGSSGPTIGSTIFKIRNRENFFLPGSGACKYFRTNEGDKTLEELLESTHIMYNDDGTVDIKNTVDSNKNPKLGFVNTSRAVGTYSMKDMPGFNIFFKKTFDTIITRLEQSVENNMTSFDVSRINNIVDEFTNFWLTQADVFKRAASGDEDSNFAHNFHKEFINFKAQHKDLFKNSLFLQNLSVINKSRYAPEGSITFKNLGNLSDNEKLVMKKEILSMYQSEDPDVRNFVVNLFKYSFIKDGLSFSRYSYAQLFPSDIRLHMGNYADILNKMDGGIKDDDIEEFVSQYILNHLKDDRSPFVKTVYKDAIRDTFFTEQKKVTLDDGSSIYVTVPKEDVKIVSLAGMENSSIDDETLVSTFVASSGYVDNTNINGAKAEGKHIVYEPRKFISVTVEGTKFYYVLKDYGDKEYTSIDFEYVPVSPLGFNATTFREYNYNEGITKKEILDGVNTRFPEVNKFDVLVDKIVEKKVNEAKKKGNSGSDSYSSKKQETKAQDKTVKETTTKTEKSAIAGNAVVGENPGVTVESNDPDATKDGDDNSTPTSDKTSNTQGNDDISDENRLPYRTVKFIESNKGSLYDKYIIDTLHELDLAFYNYQTKYENKKDVLPDNAIQRDVSGNSNDPNISINYSKLDTNTMEYGKMFTKKIDKEFVERYYRVMVDNSDDNKVLVDYIIDVIKDGMYSVGSNVRLKDLKADDTTDSDGFRACHYPF